MHVSRDRYRWELGFAIAAWALGSHYVESSANHFEHLPGPATKTGATLAP